MFFELHEPLEYLAVLERAENRFNGVAPIHFLLAGNVVLLSLSAVLHVLTPLLSKSRGFARKRFCLKSEREK
jgi:hypothetical protein